MNTRTEFQERCDSLLEDVRSVMAEIQRNADEADEALWLALSDLAREGRLTINGKRVTL